MWNLNEVTEIEYRHSYVYRIVFDDGLSGDIDSGRLLKTASSNWIVQLYT